jgi:predicted permease
MWQTRFGGDPAVVGRQFRMNGRPYTVIGVAPATFGGMVPAVTAQMWIPINMAEQVEPLGNNRTSGRSTGETRFERRGQHWLWLKGRMKPGVTPAQVRSEFVTIASRLATDYPEVNSLERVAVVPTVDVRVNPDADKAIAPVGFVLVGAVSLVLIVACGNLANLMLARAAGRRREISLRLALGAGRTRLLRQLLTESMVLAIAGGLVAIPLSAGLSALVASVRLPLPIELGLTISPDWRVLVFTMATAVATGLVIGLLPALRASRPDLVPALKEGGEWMGGKRRRVELRDALVVMQVAVSLVLVVAGALLVRSMNVAARVDLGYEVDRIAFLAVAGEMNGLEGAGAGAFFEQARQRLLAMPQVEAVGSASRVPLSLNNNGFSVFIEGHQGSASDDPYQIDGAYVDEQYLGAMGLKLVAGRGIEPADRDEQRRVAVISQTMARRFWPDREALGRDFRTRFDGEPWRVVGVVADYKVDTPGENAKPYLHLPLGRNDTFANFLVRTRFPAAPIVPLLERELRVMRPDLVFMDTGPLRQLADIRLFPVLAGAWLIGIFGLLALAVAAVGLYGVIGYSVSRRVREIGIRKALGAESGEVVGMVMKEGMILVLVGGVVGAVLAGVASRALSSVLFVGPFDLLGFGMAFAALLAVAALANAVPAWRASRVDAMVALRHD